jgi:hypothetical protein
MIEHPPALSAVARALDPLKINFAFAGGSIVGCLLDNPDVVPLRPTDDVDVIVEVITQREYRQIEERLRELGFEHDMREGAPLCRWTFRKLVVDIMPVEGNFLGLETQYFREALESAVTMDDATPPFRILSSAGFIATKLLAFRDRGEGDYEASHDIEDIITVIDGRAKIVSDIEIASDSLRVFISQSFQALLKKPSFQDALSSHLLPDRASQQRLPTLLKKMDKIAKLT